MTRSSRGGKPKLLRPAVERERRIEIETPATGVVAQMDGVSGNCRIPASAADF
jgi:hypothetical protein